MISTAVLAVAVLVLLTAFSIVRPKNFPPGPEWLPIIGNTWQVKKLSRKLGGLHLALLELSKQHNTNVLGLKMGNNYFVTVLRYKAVKTVLSSEDYDPRPTNFFIKLRCLGSIKGITCTSGEIWSVQRNFMVKALRDLGFGKIISEEQIKQEIPDIIDYIHQRNQTRVNKIIALAVISVLWSTITGTRLSKDDARFTNLLEHFQGRAKFFDLFGGFLTQYPWLRFIAPKLTGYSLILQINRKLKEIFMQPIEEHLSTWNENAERNDFIYAFIHEMMKKDAHHSFTSDQLLMSCLDLFIGGAQTASSMLDFAIALMLEHQDIQLKVQSLLDEGMDKNRPICYSDRHRFPYIEAVLLEVLRFRTVTPIIGPRQVLKDTILEGFLIPKDTTILIHTHSVHMDSSLWKDPHIFRPERFLSEDNKLIYYDELLPFGLGKRRCIAESFARTCIFIFFTEIMRNYTITKQDPDVKDGNTVPGITLSADYSARFIRRESVC